jgi:hypothetical protein
MNSAPNQQGTNFGSQPAGTQNNNPFTNDLKGEFTSNFGGTNSFGTATGTNAVSQIFKDGSFGSNNTARYVIYGALFLFVAAVGWWLMSDSSQDAAVDPEIAAEDGETKATDEAAAPSDEATTSATPAEATAPTSATAPATDASVGATGAIQLVSPENGANLAYDETQGSASFSWSGGPGTIVFSRHSSMQPEVMRIKVSAGSYSFHRPWPGQWYWKVESEAGASDIRSFSVAPPVIISWHWWFCYLER